MPDDPKNEHGQTDFDDWLAEEDAEPIDPVASVSEEEAPVDIDDAEPEEAAWSHVADTHPAEPAIDVGGAISEEGGVAPADDPIVESAGADLEEIAEHEPVEDETAEVVLEDADVADAVPDDATLADPDAITEMPAIEAPLAEETFEQPVVEFAAFDGGHEDITGELEIVSDVPADDADFVSQDETRDIGLRTPELEDGFEPFALDHVESIDVGSGDAVGEISFGEVEALPEPTQEPMVAFDAPEPPSDPPYDFSPEDSRSPDPFDDTGEAMFVTGETAAVRPIGPATTGASFAELWGVDEMDDDASHSTADVDGGYITPQPNVPDVDDDESDDVDEDLDHIQYGATREHAGLAEAIAAAETEETAQVALSAAIPGLESSVVGFEDVVEAEGHRRVRARASGDLISRVITGMVLVGALIASLFWRPALLVLATAVFLLGAGEFYTALVRHDRRPIALFGFVGIIGACAGAFWWSAAAIPISFIGASVLLLLYYAVTPGKPDPMGNLALTMTVMVWAGLGAFAMLIAKSDDYRVLIAGVVVVVAAADIAAFFVGRSIGRTKFAPWVSPNKTLEGLVAGVIVAFGLGAVLHFFPPFELTSGLAIGAAAAVLTPLGDLAMSAAKRSLGLKDMGSVLPGHGGFLDRIDGLLFTIPAAWVVFVWAGLL